VPLLRNADRAIIAAEKMRDYLLDPENPQNDGKAEAFFRLGYSRDDWEVLARDLREQHLSLEARLDAETIYGDQYVIIGTLRGPAGSDNIKSVWQFDPGSEVPRFVTAYPHK
jgi:hypothetical protein